MSLNAATRRPSNIVIPPGLANEHRTITAMMTMYCNHHHGEGDLCPECAELLAYAEQRLSRCVFGEDKPQCEKCSVHCYQKTMREKMKAVMRYAGPRMIYTHPILAIRHVLNRKSGVYDKAKHGRHRRRQASNALTA